MDLTRVKGIGNVYSKKLIEAGIHNVEELFLANENEIANKLGIKVGKVKKWKEEAKKMIKYGEAEIIEEIPKISFIEIDGEKARVKIKDYWHDAKIYNKTGKLEELKNEKVAVLFEKKPKLWFNGSVYEVPYKIKRRWWK